MAREQLEGEDAMRLIFLHSVKLPVLEIWWVDFTRAFRLQGLLP